MRGTSTPLAFLVAVLASVWCTALAAQTPGQPGAADTQAHNKVLQAAVLAANPVQAKVGQFRQHTKAFPASNADVGMNLPQTYRNYDMKSVAVRPNGIVEITMTATSGVDNGVIRFTPTATGSPEDPIIEWHCTSANYNTISDATGGVCEYTNQP